MLAVITLALVLSGVALSSPGPLALLSILLTLLLVKIAMFGEHLLALLLSLEVGALLGISGSCAAAIALMAAPSLPLVVITLAVCEACLGLGVLVQASRPSHLSQPVL